MLGSSPFFLEYVRGMSECLGVPWFPGKKFLKRFFSLGEIDYIVFVRERDLFISALSSLKLFRKNPENIFFFAQRILHLQC